MTRAFAVGTYIGTDEIGFPMTGAGAGAGAGAVAGAGADEGEAALLTMAVFIGL